MPLRPVFSPSPGPRSPLEVLCPVTETLSVLRTAIICGWALLYCIVLCVRVYVCMGGIGNVDLKYGILDHSLLNYDHCQPCSCLMFTSSSCYHKHVNSSLCICTSGETNIPNIRSVCHIRTNISHGEYSLSGYAEFTRRLQTSVTSRILDRTASSKVPSALENSQLSSRSNPDPIRGPGMELWRSNEKSRLELFFERVKCTSAGDFVKNDLEMMEK